MSRDYFTEDDHQASVRADLNRVAEALERIAAALERANPETIPGLIG